MVSSPSLIPAGAEKKGSSLEVWCGCVMAVGELGGDVQSSTSKDPDTTKVPIFLQSSAQNYLLLNRPQCRSPALQMPWYLRHTGSRHM